MTADNIIHILKYVYIGFVVFDAAVFLWVWRVTRAHEYKAKVYLLLMSTIIFWEIVMWLVYFYPGPEDIMIFLDRVSFAFGILAAYGALYLLWVITERYFSSMIVYLLGLFSFFSAAISFVPGWITRGRTSVAETTYNVVANPGVYLSHFYILLVVILLCAAYIILSGIKRTEGLHKIHLFYAGASLLLILGFGIFTSAVLQLYYLFNDLYFAQTGNTATVIAQLSGGLWSSVFGMSILTNIIRHRYFRIRVAIQKEIAYYSVLFFVAAALLAGIIAVYFFYNVVFAIISAFISVAIFIFLQKQIWDWFDALFFLGEIDLSTTPTPKMRSIPSTVHLEQAVYEILMAIAEHATKVEYVYIRQREYNRFISFHPRWEKSVLSFDSSILKQHSQDKSTAFFCNIDSDFRHFLNKTGVLKKRIYIPIVFDEKILAIVSFKENSELDEEDYKKMYEILEEKGLALRKAIDYHEAMAGFAHTWKEKYYS